MAEDYARLLRYVTDNLPPGSVIIEHRECPCTRELQVCYRVGDVRHAVEAPWSLLEKLNG